MRKQAHSGTKPRKMESAIYPKGVLGLDRHKGETHYRADRHGKPIKQAGVQGPIRPK